MDEKRKEPLSKYTAITKIVYEDTKDDASSIDTIKLSH